MFWIEGWIEVARLPETDEEHAWFAVINLASLVDGADEDSERLFGLSKSCLRGEKSVVALAAGRGLPVNPSAQVRRQIEVIAAHEAKYGPGDFGGYTYAIWNEIRAIGLVVKPPEESEWILPFELARVLAERFGSDRVRFVVWFNW